MAEVLTEQLDDLKFLGGVYSDTEKRFKEADYTGVLNDFLDVLEKKHAEYFDSQTSPVGQSWPPLAPSTIAAKGHNQILFRTGRLRESLTGKSSDAIRDAFQEAFGAGLSFGTSTPYSTFHMEDGGRLPQREHVGMNDETLDDFVDTVADHAVEELKFTS